MKVIDEQYILYIEQEIHIGRNIAEILNKWRSFWFILI